ncbi:unannotated protein [freshwater metagenome]|uniref:Unannotated protein n=1 Tax=freshwater metagenome TaxID=449393 RepID=A0A6J7QSH6_9ZZZZ
MSLQILIPINSANLFITMATSGSGTEVRASSLIPTSASCPTVLLAVALKNNSGLSAS